MQQTSYTNTGHSNTTESNSEGAWGLGWGLDMAGTLTILRVGVGPRCGWDTRYPQGWGGPSIGWDTHYPHAAPTPPGAIE
jgi:hypothetical protein